MASFEIRGGSVRAIVSLGNRQKLSQTFNTDKQARAWARDIERQRDLGKISAASKLNFGDVIRAYERISERKDSARWDLLRLRRFKDSVLADVLLSHLTPGHLQEELVEKRLKQVSPSSVNREFNLLSAAFNHAVKVMKWIPENPCRNVVLPAKGRPRNRALLTSLELQAIAISADYAENRELTSKTQRVAACFFLALETGMRSGEILRIRPQDIHFDKNTLHVHALERGGRKGSRSGQVDADRWIPLTDRAKRILQQLMNTLPKAQEAQDGFSMPPYLVGLNDAQRDALWRQIRTRSGVEGLTFHDSKHEAATRLSALMDVIALSHTLGTKDIRLLRDTYYVNNAEALAAKLPDSLTPLPPAQHHQEAQKGRSD